MPVLRVSELLNPVLTIPTNEPALVAEEDPDLVSSDDDSSNNAYYVDILPDLESLVQLANDLGSVVHAPLQVQRALQLVTQYLGSAFHSAGSERSNTDVSVVSRQRMYSASCDSIPTPIQARPTKTTFNIDLTNRTHLERLYHYDLDSYVEYPETAVNDAVGYIFRMDPAHWRNPSLDFAYSLGEPRGATPKGKTLFCPVLVDQVTGEPVPCRETHSTCM